MIALGEGVMMSSNNKLGLFDRVYRDDFLSV
jgi:hypothetical protein